MFDVIKYFDTFFNDDFLQIIPCLTLYDVFIFFAMIFSGYFVTCFMLDNVQEQSRCYLTVFISVLNCFVNIEPNGLIYNISVFGERLIHYVIILIGTLLQLSSKNSCLMTCKELVKICSYKYFLYCKNFYNKERYACLAIMCLVL